MTMIGENDSNLNNVPKMFGGIPGPSSNSGLPKKSYSISKWKPGNTLKTATTAGSNNSYLWNMPATSSTSGAAAKEDQKTSTSQTSSSSAANDNLFKDENEEEEDSDDDYSLIPTKIPTGDSPTWALGNNFDHFLNQCSIQSFLFLLKTCRDPQTVLWLEAYTQPAITTTRNRLALQEHRALQLGGSANSKLLSYHGLAAMNTTAFPEWDTYFRQLLELPVEQHIIESWQAHIPSYELEINPASLCARLLSVREQIAREFAKDLSVLATMGGPTLKTYWQGIRDQRNDSGSESSDASPEGRIVGSATLLFLDAAPEAHSDLAPSPLRKGNFDLLVLLATQESIHRVLMNTEAVVVPDQDSVGDECPVASLSRSNRNFLSHFYLQRLVSHFTGRQAYGRADQFLQELLCSAPSIIVSDNDDDGTAESCLVDPTRIAEQILEMRQVVAQEWQTRAELVPDLHVDLKRLQFNRLLQSYSTDNQDESFQ